MIRITHFQLNNVVSFGDVYPSYVQIMVENIQTVYFSQEKYNVFINLFPYLHTGVEIHYPLVQRNHIIWTFSDDIEFPSISNFNYTISSEELSSNKCFEAFVVVFV